MPAELVRENHEGDWDLWRLECDDDTCNNSAEGLAPELSNERWRWSRTIKKVSENVKYIESEALCPECNENVKAPEEKNPWEKPRPEKNIMEWCG